MDIDTVLNLFGSYKEVAGAILLALIVILKNFVKTPEAGTWKYSLYVILCDWSTANFTKLAKEDTTDVK